MQWRDLRRALLVAAALICLREDFMSMAFGKKVVSAVATLVMYINKLG